MKKVICIHAGKCDVTKQCTHGSPHEVIRSNSKYSYHNCEEERTLMCGTDENGHKLDGNCQEIKKVGGIK